jgi:ATP-dependent nuclease, subunit B
MGVTVVCGRSGSGKSRYIMAHIKALIADPFARVLVIVPGQLTFETEKHIMEACGVEGIFGLQVLSIQRLAAKVIEDTGACEFITGAERAMIASRALSMMAQPFHGADSQPDFEACAAELIARLKGHRQTPQNLRNAAGSLRDAALRQKLRDTAELLENYDAICAGRVDFADIYAVAAQRAQGANLLRGAHIVIDGLDSTSPAVMAFYIQSGCAERRHCRGVSRLLRGRRRRAVRVRARRYAALYRSREAGRAAGCAGAVRACEPARGKSAFIP